MVPTGRPAAVSARKSSMSSHQQLLSYIADAGIAAPGRTLCQALVLGHGRCHFTTTLKLHSLIVQTESERSEYLAGKTY
jgi:hypothetical protein